jgi:hypothetical protein
MTRRYLTLFVVALIVAIALVAWSRMPRSTSPSASVVEAAEPLTLDLFDDRVVTTPEAIPVGRRVELSVVNHSTTAARIELAGYEDRVSAARIDPDSTWRTTFTADRPGEQLAWIVNGEPRGRLDVVGSHLVEGHR